MNAITTLSLVLTQPAEGVMATNPTTPPMAAPIADGFLPLIQSKKIHVIIAVAAAVLVFKNALTAMPSACKLEPALNPNQPNHNKAAPNIT